MNDRRSRTSASGRLAAPVRVALASAVVVLVAVVAWRFPVVSDEAWPRPRTFTPDDAACAEERQGRQWTGFEVPAEAGFVTVAEVARKHNLESAWICRANGREADCGGERLRPGETLVLPLHRQAVEAARAAVRAGGPGAAGASGATPPASRPAVAPSPGSPPDGERRP